MNIAGLLTRAAAQRGGQEALRFGERSETYGQLTDRSARLGAGMRELGLPNGARVALLQTNGIELVETMFGAWMAGLTVVPINSRAHAREAAYIIAHSGAKAVVYGSRYEDDLLKAIDSEQVELICIADRGREDDYEALVAKHEPLGTAMPRAPEDPAWLFYTSGTTGRPKGAMLSHRNLRQMILSHLADVRSFQPGETVLHAAPLTHGSGLVLLSSVARGARNVIYPHDSFDGARVLELVAYEGVASIAFLAPTQIVAMNRAAESSRNGDGGSLLNLQSVCYGGAPMFVDDLRRAVGHFGSVFVQIYGQGEAPMTISVLAAVDHQRFIDNEDPRLGSAGLPRTDVEIKVLGESGEALSPGETGEVAVRGDVVMLGYWKDQIATETAVVDGWLRTGDIGLIDATGYLHLLDRSKDMIISGGNNIYPREVEDAILELAQVAAVAVIGLPDEYWGENVHALVVPNDGKQVTSDDVISHCRSVLASYKKPRTVEFVDRLPTNAYGKIMKRELRESRV